MPHFWLVLWLLLLLWPSPAAASPAAYSGDPASAAAVDDVRAPDGVQTINRPWLGLGLAAHEPRCGGGCSQRSDRGHGGFSNLEGSHHVPDGRGALLAHRGAPDVDQVVPPLCERLPYFATAPPRLAAALHPVS